MTIFWASFKLIGDLCEMFVLLSIIYHIVKLDKRLTKLEAKP